MASDSSERASRHDGPDDEISRQRESNDLNDPDLRAKIDRVLKDEIELQPHDPQWGEWFRQEEQTLREALPKDLVRRIEHFGSTAVTGLCAKPIVDILVEVTSLKRVREEVAAQLECVLAAQPRQAVHCAEVSG